METRRIDQRLKTKAISKGRSKKKERKKETMQERHLTEILSGNCALNLSWKHVLESC